MITPYYFADEELNGLVDVDVVFGRSVEPAAEFLVAAEAIHLSRIQFVAGMFLIRRRSVTLDTQNQSRLNQSIIQLCIKV
jgi:hypothetical protein